MAKYTYGSPVPKEFWDESEESRPDKECVALNVDKRKLVSRNCGERHFFVCEKIRMELTNASLKESRPVEPGPERECRGDLKFKTIFNTPLQVKS